MTRTTTRFNEEPHAPAQRWLFTMTMAVVMLGLPSPTGHAQAGSETDAQAAAPQAVDGGQSGLVSVKDGEVILHVPIWFNADPFQGRALEHEEMAAFEASLEKIGTDVETFLNDAFAKMTFDGCYRFKVDVTHQWATGNPILDDSKANHVIQLSWDPGFRSMTYSASGTGLSQLDHAQAWEFYSTGEWAYFNMTPRDYAHEVMHLFGLGDDYRAVYDADGAFDHAIPRPGREGTLMDGGDFVDQDLIDRLGKLLREAEELPNCWVATLELDTSATYPDEARTTCRDEWLLTARVLVDDRGDVSGSGLGEVAVPAVCPFPIAGVTQWQRVEYSVTGQQAGDNLVLQFELDRWDPPGGANLAGLNSMFLSDALPGSGLPITVPVAGGGGSAAVDWKVQSGSPPATYAANGTIEARCLTCAAPVGAVSAAWVARAGSAALPRVRRRRQAPTTRRSQRRGGRRCN